MQSRIPESFQRSYGDFESYPRKLICQTTYREAAVAYVARLDNEESTLFLSIDDEEIEVPFRDLLPSGQGFKKQNVYNDEALKLWLGDESRLGPGPSGTLVGNLATKKDPLCRFIYLYAENSREPLKLSRKMLVRILSYHQVMPSYIDFLCVFGSQDEPRDLRFASFREQTLISEPARGPAVESLGRSGRQFQICYNLKAANCTSSANTKVQAKQWSIRQVAIHHQFDVKTGTTLWIVTKGDKEIKNRIEDLTGPDGRPEDTDFSTPEECFKRTLGAHMVYCHWSAEEWRPYVQWLEEYIDRGASDPPYRSICALANQQQQTAMVFAPRGGSFPCYKFEPKHVQDVHSLEEKVNIAVLLLEANVNIIKLLKEFYERLVVDKNFPWKESCKDHVIAFSDQLNVLVSDLETEISRAKLLNRIIGERKALVLQHIQAQSTEKMEQLTSSMGELGIMAQKEAIAMRIITVVTVIFLPATFVSTFFSTEIVNYQNSGGFSYAALLGWLEVTIPLTLLTLGVCYFFFKRSTRTKLRDLKLIIKKQANKFVKA